MSSVCSGIAGLRIVGMFVVSIAIVGSRSVVGLLPRFGCVVVVVE